MVEQASRVAVGQRRRWSLVRGGPPAGRQTETRPLRLQDDTNFDHDRLIKVGINAESSGLPVELSPERRALYRRPDPARRRGPLARRL